MATVHDLVRDVLWHLVQELVEDILENHADMSRRRLQAFIDARVNDAVRERFAIFQARLNRACEE